LQISFLDYVGIKSGTETANPMTDQPDDEDKNYRRSAEVVYRELQDYAEFARRLQSE
jgi:hypothetical protein